MTNGWTLKGGVEDEVEVSLTMSLGIQINISPMLSNYPPVVGVRQKLVVKKEINKPTPVYFNEETRKHLRAPVVDYAHLIWEKGPSLSHPNRRVGCVMK